MKYAAIIKSSIFVPGDERSRTNPGHGYPERYEDTISLIEFATESAMKTWVRQQEDPGGTARGRYRLIQFDGLYIEKSVEITFKKL